MAIYTPTASVLASAAAALVRGELVAFPTETVYGLGANALDPNAVARIFEAKARPAWNPVIVHVTNADEAQALTSHWPARATRLAEHCWPGPLTLVLPRATHVPAVVAAGRDTVAVRVPAHPVALALLAQAQRPIAAPSANRFMSVSPTTAQHVVDGLGDRVSMVLDGGRCDVGIESTVLDLTGESPQLLRYGGVSAATLSELLSEPVRPVPAHHRADADADAPLPAPGMVARHYAPLAEAWLVGDTDIADALRAVTSVLTSVVTTVPVGATPSLRATIPRIGVVTWRDASPLAEQLRATLAERSVSLQHHALGENPAGYARALYATLRALDADGCTHLLLEAPPEATAWDAVRDRLQRASHPAS